MRGCSRGRGTKTRHRSRLHVHRRRHLPRACPRACGRTSANEYEMPRFDLQGGQAHGIEWRETTNKFCLQRLRGAVQLTIQSEWPRVERHTAQASFAPRALIGAAAGILPSVLVTFSSSVGSAVARRNAVSCSNASMLSCWNASDIAPRQRASRRIAIHRRTQFAAAGSCGLTADRSEVSARLDGRRLSSPGTCRRIIHMLRCRWCVGTRSPHRVMQVKGWMDLANGRCIAAERSAFHASGRTTRHRNIAQCVTEDASGTHRGCRLERLAPGRSAARGGPHRRASPWPRSLACYRRRRIEWFPAGSPGACSCHVLGKGGPGHVACEYAHGSTTERHNRSRVDPMPSDRSCEARVVRAAPHPTDAVAGCPRNSTRVLLFSAPVLLHLHAQLERSMTLRLQCDASAHLGLPGKPATFQFSRFTNSFQTSTETQLTHVVASRG